jgi:hypothetical protein
MVVIDGPSPSINGRSSGPRELLSDGDVLSIAGQKLVHEWAPETLSSDWAVELGSSKFAVVKSPFAIGGSERDDLVVPSWPASAVTLFVAGADLVLEPAVVVTVSGRETNEHASLRDRDTVALGEVRLRLRRRSVAEATTIGDGGRPTRLTLELLPNGGLLTVHHWVTRAVWLADRRCDLVAALLRPPSGLRPGDFVPDAKLIKRVWPNEAATRSELNTLVYRTRQTLTRAGLDGAALVERASSGGSTRFAVAEGAVVDVTG